MSDTSLDKPFAVQTGFRVGDVFNKSFRLFGQGWRPFMIITGVASLPTLPMTLALAGLDPQALAKGTLPPGFFMIIGASVLVGLLVYPISQAMVLKIAFQSLRGETLDMNRAFSAALSRALPVVGTSLYVTLLYVLGLLLFVIPGCIVIIAGAVAVQVCVVESLGPVAAFKRSAFLTRGHRWQILGTLLAVGIVAGMANAIITNSATLSVGPKIAVLLAYPVAVVVRSFGAIVGTVIYHDLRVAKEGLDTDRIAAVFE